VSFSNFKIGRDAFQIRTTSKEFARWMNGALDAYRTRREAPVTYSIVVSGGEADNALSGKRFHVLYWEFQRVLRTLDITTLARGLLAEIESTLLPDREDAIYVRSAAVEGNGRIALIPDFFRSTLERMGRRVDRVGLRLPAERVVGVQTETGRLVRIAPRLEIPGDAIDRLSQMFAVNDEHQIGRIDRPVSADVVFVPRGENHNMQPISRGRALYGLAHTTLNMTKMQGRALKGLARLVENAECYGFYAGDATPQGRSVLLAGLVQSLHPDRRG
jgi:hypothetical protein